ncbi:MAG TPA: hypothetical protein GX526_02250, partial [Thermoanaerobacterales bacterium]|nr:hypothetical protein [Thermoanaerobacterales bacterium]
MTKIVGIAGTAKNTGKTSVVSNLLIKGKENNIKIGLTSIGYDGESTDNITGLPKPRLIVSNGTIVAIAEKCLTNTTAELKIIKKTNFVTPLGRVVIGIIKKEGLVVLAGPNKTRDLKAVISQMKELGSELIIVDGALNRLAPMSVVENIVLATGAAKNRDLNQLAIETLCLFQIFELSDKCTMSDSKEGSYNGILLNTINNKSIVLNTTSLVN